MPASRTSITSIISKLIARFLGGDKPSSHPVWQKFDQDSKRGEISLSDLMISLYDLPWENEDPDIQEALLKQIVQSLGFTLSDAARVQALSEASQTRGVYDHDYYDRRIRRKANPPELPHTAPPAPELPIDLSDQAIKLDHTLKPRETNEDQQPPPHWLTRDDLAETFPPLFDENNNQPKPLPVPRKMLFPENTSRGILSASLTTQRTGNEVDIRQVISSIVRGDILQTLPKQTATTLDQGCQLLLDYSESMVPYWEDLHALIKQIQNITGVERVQIYEFDGSPLLAKRWLGRKNKQDWQVETARPVVVATDFGMNPANDSLLGQSDWPDFVENCASRQVPLIILTPLAKTNWPEHIGSYPILIHWHPRTTAGMVRKLIGKGHKVDT